MYQKDVGKIELKKPDIKKIAGAEMIKFQQNLDELPASCEREAPGRTGSLWPLQFLQFLEVYIEVYTLIYSHIKIAFTGREVIPQKKMECKQEEKRNVGQTKTQEISTLTCLAISDPDMEQNKQAPTNQLVCQQ